MKMEAGSVKAPYIFLNGVLISILCMGLLSVCIENRKEETQDVVIKEIERLSFSEQGSEAPMIVMTVLSREEKGTCICFVTADEEKYEYREDITFMDQVQEILDIYEVGNWNGFCETDSAVLDGTGFSLLVRFSDGTRLSAWGNNAFPEHYQEVSSALKELVQPVKERFLKEHGDELDLKQ